MAAAKPQLILIPGLGDGWWIYRVFAWRLRRLGYNVHLFDIAWNGQQELFDAKLARLVAAIDALQAEQVDIVGVSAGGVAAVHAFASRPANVRKVVTICSPYVWHGVVRNKALDAGLRHIEQVLQTLSADQKSRILSVHAIADGIVQVAHSQPRGIQHRQLLSRGHPLTIFLALTLYASIFRHFLK